MTVHLCTSSYVRKNHWLRPKMFEFRSKTTTKTNFKTFQTPRIIVKMVLYVRNDVGKKRDANFVISSLSFLKKPHYSWWTSSEIKWLLHLSLCHFTFFELNTSTFFLTKDFKTFRTKSRPLRRQWEVVSEVYDPSPFDFFFSKTSSVPWGTVLAAGTNRVINLL
jgi:hypothetical protein